MEAMHNRRAFRWTPALLLILLWITGCSGAFTHARLDPDLTEDFAAHRFPDGYEYYYLGWENRPYAIVGLEPGYTLTNRFYKPVAEADRPMKRLVDALYEAPHHGPDAARIVDHQGRRIGVWFSSARLASFKIDPETRRVSVFSDEPWIKDGGEGMFHPSSAVETSGREETG